MRIRLGPLTRAQYETFLPTGSAYPVLGRLVQFFSHDEFTFELQLVLARDAVPTCRLGADEACPVSLGWGTWLRTAPAAGDADETILTL